MYTFTVNKEQLWQVATWDGAGSILVLPSVILREQTCATEINSSIGKQSYFGRTL